MERVKVCGKGGLPSLRSAGLFTRMVAGRFPLIPVEEEGRLADPVLREMFIERMFCLRRFRDLAAAPLSRGGLLEFHADHKMLLLSHGRAHYEEMGRLLARAKRLPVEALHEKYQELFLSALAHNATPKKRADALMHMMGHVRKYLSSVEKQELVESIDRYRLRLVPLAVPVTLLRKYVRKFDVRYLARQAFLNPHPAELSLRDHV
jgi:uncharacterized protein YbgA (DUF1722 family)